MSKESNDITLHSSWFNAPITDFRLIEPTFIFRYCRFVQRTCINGMTLNTCSGLTGSWHVTFLKQLWITNIFYPPENNGYPKVAILKVGYPKSTLLPARKKWEPLLSEFYSILLLLIISVHGAMSRIIINNTFLIKHNPTICCLSRADLLSWTLSSSLASSATHQLYDGLPYHE